MLAYDTTNIININKYDKSSFVEFLILILFYN